MRSLNRHMSETWISEIKETLVHTRTLNQDQLSYTCFFTSVDSPRVFLFQWKGPEQKETGCMSLYLYTLSNRHRSQQCHSLCHRTPTASLLYLPSPRILLKDIVSTRRLNFTVHNTLSLYLRME